MQAKTKFKKTPIGEIPEDWEVVKISEIARKIKAGGTPKTTIKEYYENGDIPFVKIENITTSGKYLEKTKTKITKKGLENSSAWLVPSGSILFAMYGSIGAVTINKIPVATNQAILGIIINDKEADVEFVYYLLKFLGPLFEKHSKQTTQANLTAKIVKEFKIPLPPLSEQKKIAEILRTVDEAIEKTDLAIEKTERLKKGLMQRLLTRGIKHERFKKTEIGEIPEEWEVVRLEELLTAIQDTPHKVPKKTNSGIPFVSVNYVLQFPDYNFYIDHSKEGIEYISEDNIEFLKKFTPESGDIIYTKWGTPGVAKLVNTGDRFVGLCSLALLKPKRSIVYSLFLVYALNSNATRKQIIPHSKTSTRTEIHKKHIRNILLPLPPLPEQQKIAEILMTVDKKLELLRKRKEKLERIKRGLMKDLLTGRRRVRV